ncbi:amino acid adenylation domain-containing protein [Cronbergia sp. UHCC 0137]|uniref:non-ribosomal peptide synthetase n=1 Tax=Cronbergia sp. UHCC 0137 TaxID=3110239 RepID=UPI002B1F7C1E|nr:non-ribosomal peptide synthetase [Cronbergia sp. UHCC 0137]MEA5616258.1 amino acid adenylation domain-containing protein [Cronbergia sp. UHCC 0137]
MEVYVLPLSLSQRQLWYQEILSPGNIAYNIPIALHLSGNLDRVVLGKCFQEIINRHEILRTTFALEEGEPVQLIHAEQEFDLEEKIIELSLDQKIQEILEIESRQPFNLVTGPLMRVILYQISSQEHILLVNLHHIISDGWSLGIFVQELTQLYTAAIQGSQITLPDLPIQYGDYAEWQETWLQTPTIQQQLTYWEQALAAPLPILDLPLDKNRPTSQTFQGAVLREPLSIDVIHSLEALATAESVTFFMVTLAVYQILLFRYSGQTDIIVGSPFANRRKNEIEHLIGFFVNTLPLRCNFTGQLSFRQLLQQISSTCVEAFAHQDVPLELIIDKLKIKRDPVHPPIFQTLFALQNAPIGEIKLPGITVKPIYLDNGGAKFDLSLMLEPGSEGWITALEYNTDLFTAETAQEILTHYQQLLTAVINNPDTQIDVLPWLNREERKELLALGSISQNIEVEQTNLINIFTKTVKNHSDIIAVVDSETKLTYQELDQRTNQLAALLKQKGVTTETKVGIFQERSLELIISILAVLKAGGTYVPLDPQYPAERLNFIAEDSGIKLLLTKESLLSEIPAAISEIIILDKIELTENINNVNLTSQILPEQTAYIIYTSGSTGQPKGCLVSHKNVIRLMKNTQKWFEFNDQDVWTMFHSFAFDFSVWEMWGALLYGGKLVIVPYLESRSPSAFRELLQREGVTILNQTPSAFRQLIRADGEYSERLNSLRAVIFGGEALELQSLKPWIKRYGESHPRLINMYGITETTVHVTYRQILAEDILENRGSVIGVPISDLSLYILDSAFEPAPYGVAGEIYVGGMGVSRGYLNRASLTAQRFIPDPFSQQPGARLYRTGDLARRLRNGDIEYLGRCDLQVKIRGFRIELGEIEAALASLPQISEAVVIVHSSVENEQRLVAYIVANANIDRNELRTALKERLPDYMIPAAFMLLDAIPLTAQGKINRSALPLPDWNQATTRKSFTPPQTDAEKVLCGVWEQVLSIDKIGIEDNFFDLGGDSILALRVVTEMRRQGWILTPKEIFQEQTVQRLAMVAQIQNCAISQNQIATGEVPLTPIQKWFFELDIPNPDHWNQTLLLEVHPSLEASQVATALQVIFSHHDNFRLRFTKEAENWRQFYVEKDVTLAWEIVDLGLRTEVEQNAIMGEVRERVERSLNLSNGPLYRVVWFNLGEHCPAQLLIVIHHLIIDGVSWRILLQDLVELISGSQISPTTSSWQQWSQFLHSYINSPNIQTEKQFWLNTLQKETAKLPLDFPQSVKDNLESSVKTVSCQLTTEQTQILLTKANKTYRTQPQELLLAALAKTLVTITQQSHIQIMMEGHGREELSADLDITRTLGWFTTLYPFSLELPEINLASEIIKTVKEQLRNVPQRGFGYGILRYLEQGIGSEENSKFCNYQPPEISFNYLGQVRNESGKNQLFRLLNSEVAPTRHPQGVRPHIIDINAIVVEGELRVDWLYSCKLHQSATIIQWVNEFKNNLLEILNHCTEIAVGGYTPSDFPLVKIQQSKLDIIQNQYPQLEDIYPLSPLQQGMLFHAIYEPEQGIYFEQVTGKIIGKFNIDNFDYAWQVVVDRHPILRSAFVWDHQDIPLQIVNKSLKFSIIQKDWRDLSPTQQETELQQYLITDKQQGFSLNQSPLMRFTVIRLNDSTWQWLWSHHHIILDGWSLPVIFKEVLTIYQSICQRVAHALPPVPPYRHYIQWLAGRNQQKSKQFWQQHLAGISTSTRLNWEISESEFDHNLPAYQEVELRLNVSEFALLQKMAQTQRLTLNTIAQGAWAMCLQKHGAGEDVIFGVTVSGRPPELAEVENMVGLFINTLPMRVEINPSLSVANWLQNIQQHHVEMREYEYSKLTDIQKECNLSGSALFESILVFENYPVDQSLKEQVQDFRVDDIQFYERTNYPLTVGVIPDQGLLLKLNYQTKFLSINAAENLISRFKNIIINMAEQPEVMLGKIQAVSPTEREENIKQSQANSNNWGDFRPSHQLFENHVDLQPNQVALVCDDANISYGELEKRANSLAAKLLEIGIGDESIVGLYFDHSIEYIIALLAVLKVGAAFLPLDRNYPENRLKFIVEDSQTRLILTEEVIAPGLFPENVKLLAIGELDLTLNTARLNLKVRPENLAYVIYTSGSTGKPKGVLVPHGGIQNLVRAQTASFGVTETSRVYQFAALNFDAAISEIFMALGSGATLYLRSQANRSPSAELWKKLTSWKITHVTLPPSLVAAINTADLPELQTLIVAGESVSGDLLRRWSVNQRRCFNAYGPTETTVCASLMDCSNLLGEVSIGSAIANVEIYLLDSFLEPVVPGVIGEIYIGGISLARGYLHRPDLTATAFIPHPFSKTPGARLYKTGDRGVYDLQGNIRFMGRQDAQVKLNGYRIELGEIEAALTRHETVDSAVVMLRQDLPGRKRIVGYALAPQDNPPTSQDLKDYLAQVLPAYMIPSVVVLVPAWPLTPNGKIDRRLLPAPELSQTEAIAKTHTEEIFAQIWTEVLGIETVNPQDNFFELGGDSIISLQIVARARASGWEINPRDIFEAQTLSRLAAIAKPFAQKQEIIEPLNGIIPLSPIQNWFFAKNWTHPHHWNQAIALNCNEPLNIDAFILALDAVVAHHDIFRVGFSQQQGQWQQFYTGTAQTPPLQIADFSHHPPQTQRAALTAIVETEHSSFQFDHPPLLRFLYVSNLIEYGNILFIFAHHLIIDGVSWRILLEDLNQAYQQVLDHPESLQERGFSINNQPISLPPKTSSYRQWTTSLQTLSNSSEIIKDIPFWQNIISTPVSQLPVDFPFIANKNTVESTAILSSQLSPEETNTLLKQTTTTYHANIQEIMLAALLKTLAETYKSDHWLIDLEGHGREELIEQLDISRTIGWFTSLYPILLQKPSTNTEQDTLIKAIKTQLRTIPHHGISFGLLRYLSQNQTLQETLKNANQAAISFNYLGQIDNLPKTNHRFTISHAPTGTGLCPQQERPHLLAINARIQNELLQIEWSYSQNIHHSQTIKYLAENYLYNLRSYLTDSTATNSSFYSATDFHLVNLSENELDSILEDLE